MAAIRPNQRQHYWDSLRGFLMLLGIPYHAALPYRAGKEWIVTSPDQGLVFAQIAETIHIFRMPAFFIIAGYFAAMLLQRRDPATWFRGRMVRLGVPFLTALLLIVPIANVFCEVSHLKPHEAINSFKGQMESSGGYWVRHLWFIIVLMYFSAAAAALMALRPAWKNGDVAPALDGWVARHLLLALAAIGIVAGLWEAFAIEGFYQAGLATDLWQQILRLDEVLEFAPWFVLGVLLQRAPQTLEAIARFRWPVAVVAVVTLPIGLALEDVGHPLLQRFVDTLAALAIAQLLVTFARRWFDRPIVAVDKLVEASFVIYLVHFPIVIAMIDLMFHVSWPPALEYAIIVTVTLGLSYVVWLAVKNAPLARFMLDGKVIPPRSPAPRPVRATR